jgi:hypothetical protein
VVAQYQPGAVNGVQWQKPRAALHDRQLLGAALGSANTWETWCAVLRAAFGLPLGERNRLCFDAVAGGRKPPQQRMQDLWCVAGRRSGKSRMAAVVATFIAAFIGSS